MHAGGIGAFITDRWQFLGFRWLRTSKEDANGEAFDLGGSCGYLSTYGQP